jgi:hypothetical protein
MTTTTTTTKKTLDIAIRERVEAEARAIMADHPEVEAIGVMFLSKYLTGILSAMIVNADGKPLRPDQNVRLFEVWVRVGMQLMANSQRDVQFLDQMLADYARRFVDAKTAAEAGQQQRAGPPGADGQHRDAEP